ncbi:hypothetical protein BDA99DRAFT_565568 [Phascolomyces articulosus]|uniref:Uncharacterized protein n=1 Tax=Phascolomyces articulosus TaxID=60185 RepID=A0AAD5K113_9FUNG|nr:hypothetical protein BDA99DRAFT_565568 [Phascolomyces articulosus]
MALLTTKPDFRSQWISWFTITSRRLKKTTEIGKPDWTKISQALPATLPGASTSTTSPSVSSSGSSSGSSSYSSTSRLTTKQKKEYEDLYTSLNPSDKWKLSTSKIVEDQMFDWAKKCEYHHPSHSLILDPKDSCWRNYFTEAELMEIKTENRIVLDPLPNDLQVYLNSYIGKHDLEELFEHHNAKLFHPKREADLHWAQKMITEALDLYFYDFFPIEGRSESDIIHRVWDCVEKCYDESNIKVSSGEKVSSASSNRINGEREIAGIEKPGKKQMGHRVDLLFTFKKQEYGCCESGAKEDKNGLKALQEGNLKVPRILKDMLRELVTESPTKLRQTKVAAFVTNGLLLSLIVLDSPAGSIVRVSRIGPLSYPDAPDVFSKKIIPILSLIWQVKSLMNTTLKIIRFDDTVVMPTFDSLPCPLLGSISSPKTKKRKLGDDDEKKIDLT